VLLSLKKPPCVCQGFASFLSFTLAVTLHRGGRLSELGALVDDVATASAAAHIKSEALNG
jgi:hypothetical protein